MFIEDLWKKNPKIVEKTVKNIMNFSDELNDYFKFDGITTDNCLKFVITKFNWNGENETYVWVGDYEFIWREAKAVKGFHADTNWMRVMYSIYGKEYMQGFLAYRDNMFEKEMKEYKKRFNHQTENILNELDIDMKDIQSQTK